MRLVVRAGLVLAGAFGFCFVLSAAASADTVDPSSAYQPTSAAILEMAKTGSTAGMMPLQGEDAPQAGSVPPTAETRGKAPVATPAPEQQVRAVPAHLTSQVEAPSSSGFARAIQPLRMGAERIGSFLGRVVSSCQVAAGSGAGGPVLVLAVLSMVVALDRRRVLGIWSATDEDAPELLFASEVIKPG